MVTDLLPGANWVHAADDCGHSSPFSVLCTFVFLVAVIPRSLGWTQPGPRKTQRVAKIFGGWMVSGRAREILLGEMRSLYLGLARGDDHSHAAIRIHDEPIDARESSCCSWAMVAQSLGPRDRGR